MNRIVWLLFATLWAGLCATQGADKKIVLLAGSPSHGPGDHVNLDPKGLR